jgi:hypothetical protein
MPHLIIKKWELLLFFSSPWICILDFEKSSEKIRNLEYNGFGRRDCLWKWLFNLSVEFSWVGGFKQKTPSLFVLLYTPMF